MSLRAATDVIKELNVPCGEAAPAAPAERSRSQEERQRDAVGVAKTPLRTLEQGGSRAGAAAAEHAASSQKDALFDKAGDEADEGNSFDVSAKPTKKNDAIKIKVKVPMPQA
jgi:hypothetical protein